ncbi:hypothetical protein CB0940_05568 [Cercospora beticola]|uniref:Uncharacterized protein n=1 Tax=Cercospora beticola TaxID=122368 RepID=A0A2G5I0G3_CERBT|nr:hypothetical protein CB0940_05568 [Cercospora beticola]PIA97982.1 hypothetical protein CB0940_05568 [Cercospora beticola]
MDHAVWHHSWCSYARLHHPHAHSHRTTATSTRGSHYRRVHSSRPVHHRLDRDRDSTVRPIRRHQL